MLIFQSMSRDSWEFASAPAGTVAGFGVVGIVGVGAVGCLVDTVVDVAVVDFLVDIVEVVDCLVDDRTVDETGLAVDIVGVGDTRPVDVERACLSLLLSNIVLDPVFGC